MDYSKIIDSGNLFKADSTQAIRGILESKDSFRDEFEKDRDRILYSKEFRRLSGKTQVFTAGFDDNMRTRLTHTLEVAHISKAVASNLGLNIDLAEAIALGHDVGHAPFGHVGERTLNLIMNGCILKDVRLDYRSSSGFKHNLQSIRVLTELEKTKQEYSGLNLTNYTLWGILNHTNVEYSKCWYYNEENKECFLNIPSNHCLLEGKTGLNVYNQFSDYISNGQTFEALVVGFADETAQRHHDIEDGLYAKLINGEELLALISDLFTNIPNIESFKKLTELRNDIMISSSVFMPRLSSFLIEMYRIEFSKHLAQSFEILLHNCVNRKENIEIKLSPELFTEFHEIRDPEFEEFLNQDSKLKKFLISKIVTSELAQVMDEKADYVIRQLFLAYIKNPLLLPDNTIKMILEGYDPNQQINSHDYRSCLNEVLKSSNREFDKRLHLVIRRKICDHLAGMTDQYAMEQYHKLFGTNSFRRGQ